MQTTKKETPWYNFVPTKPMRPLSAAQQKKLATLIEINSVAVEEWMPEVPHPLTSQHLTTLWFGLDYQFHLEDARDMLQFQLLSNQAFTRKLKKGDAAMLEDTSKLILWLLKIVNDSIDFDLRLYHKR